MPPLDTPSLPPLRLRPFLGMRFNADVVGDIGEVTSPPYDVMDRPMIDALLHQHPRNIVRLILPRLVNDPVTDSNPYVRAATMLCRWRSKWVLVTDSQPGLYVYEYGDSSHTVCGLVGALDLRKREEHVVLPHEDVISGIVADRLAMMAASEANLEPILLVYDGDGATSDVIATTRASRPLTDVSASDGTYHRLWQISDENDLRDIRRKVAPHQALIADGHHRYASYLQLRKRHRSIGDGSGPWDRGLALLIDQSQWPLQVGPIHRSVCELRLDAVVAPSGFAMVTTFGTDSEFRPPARRGEFVITDGTSRRELRYVGPRDAAITDAELLHERLLSAWGVDGGRVGYHHTVAQALRNANQDEGVAVLLHPTTVAEVMDVARAGKIMPRKSTSFGPKPRMGLIMRSFADEP